MWVLLATGLMCNGLVGLTFLAVTAVMCTRFTHQTIFAAKKKKKTINEKLPFASRFNGSGERSVL